MPKCKLTKPLQHEDTSDKSRERFLYKYIKVWFVFTNKSADPYSRVIKHREFGACMRGRVHMACCALPRMLRFHFVNTFKPRHVMSVVMLWGLRGYNFHFTQCWVALRADLKALGLVPSLGRLGHMRVSGMGETFKFVDATTR